MTDAELRKRASLSWTSQYPLIWSFNLVGATRLCTSDYVTYRIDPNTVGRNTAPYILNTHASGRAQHTPPCPNNSESNDDVLPSAQSSVQGWIWPMCRL